MDADVGTVVTKPDAKKPGAKGAAAKAGWGVIGMLAAAQFIMVLDTTVMNVSISQVVADLNTTVVGLQTAITFYTLVMAAFMLLGGKLGDRWGSKRAFTIGLLIYGTGSLITAFSPNLAVLLVGWSFVEGFGAVLVIPAIAALVAGTYTGKQRALAYGILGGVSGASAAAGPLIGGYVTANYTWRLVFAGETVVVLLVMLFLALIPKTVGRPSKLDVPGAVYSALGLGFVVFGILRSSAWGWVKPTAGVPVVNGIPVAPLGLSPTTWFIAAGIGLLVLFVHRERAVMAAGGEPLLDVTLLRIPRLRAGLTTLACQQLIIMSTFFVLPMYLQTVLGYDALQTGIVILPLSIALFLFALGGSAMTGRYSPRVILQVGLAAMLVGELALNWFTGPDLRSVGFGVALFLVGAGLGLLASQLGNVIMSSVSSSRGGEAGGLQGTAQNLGASLGTALIGSLLIASLATNFQTTIVADPALPDTVKNEVTTAASTSANFVTASTVASAATAAGLPQTEVDVIVSHYTAAQIEALQTAFGAIAVFALLAIVYVRRMPSLAESMHPDEDPDPGTDDQPAEQAA
jgi:MFS family permease